VCVCVCVCVCVFATGGRAGGVRTSLQPARAQCLRLWTLFSFLQFLGLPFPFWNGITSEAPKCSFHWPLTLLRLYHTNEVPYRTLIGELPRRVGSVGSLHALLRIIWNDGPLILGDGKLDDWVTAQISFLAISEL